jgi:ABC-type polysaccharide/polyol phosphate export permease
MLFVRFEDSKHILTIVLQLLTYLTPIFYPKEALSAHARILISVNPLSSYLDVFRYLFNGTEQASLFDWSYMFISAFSIFTLGIIVFRKFWTRTVVML